VIRSYVGNNGVVYASVREAARLLGLSPSGITRNLKGEQRTVTNVAGAVYYFRYAESPSPKNIES
jgi:hypothetical protein